MTLLIASTTMVQNSLLLYCLSPGGVDEFGEILIPLYLGGGYLSIMSQSFTALFHLAVISWPVCCMPSLWVITLSHPST
jgi:hypothetical protein